MRIIVSASTDTGNTKTVNQDSVTVQLLEGNGGQMAFAVLCDGMGGLQRGELASASVLCAFRRWREKRLHLLMASGFLDHEIRRDWSDIFTECNEKLKLFGRRNGVRLGTTATVMLLTPGRYFVANVGDSRAYEIQEQTRQLTKDQSVVAREVELGQVSIEQAERDPRRNILLQCVGASEEVCADFYFGIPRKDAVYMLCSDGFRHKISQGDMLAVLGPRCMDSAERMAQNEKALIRLAKERGERDNITVATMRTFG